MQNGKRRLRTVRISPDIDQQIEKLAESERRTFTNALEIILIAGLKDREEGRRVSEGSTQIDISALR
jgi:hypothetical protein